MDDQCGGDERRGDERRDDERPSGGCRSHGIADERAASAKHVDDGGGGGTGGGEGTGGGAGGEVGEGGEGGEYGEYGEGGEGGEGGAGGGEVVPDEAIPVARAVDHGFAKLMPDVDRPRAWLLTVDGAPQSYVDLDEPTYLEFEYARRLAHVLDTAAGPGQPLDVVHLGGGALTLPRYVAATRPGSRQDVVEADRKLLELVTEQLPWAGSTGISAHAADARQWLEAAPDDSADVLVADVFGGSRVPAHLTTVAYARTADRVLRPGGVYAANLADGAPFAFLRSQLATFAAVFGELALMAEPSVLRGRRFGNAVLVAAHRPLDIAALARRAASDAFPARVEHGDALRRLIGGAEPVRDEDAVPSPEPPDGTFVIG